MSENAENKQNEKQILSEKESEVDEELNTLLESLYHFLLIKWQIVALIAVLQIQSLGREDEQQRKFQLTHFLLIQAARGYVLRYMFAVIIPMGDIDDSFSMIIQYIYRCEKGKAFIHSNLQRVERVENCGMWISRLYQKM